MYYPRLSVFTLPLACLAMPLAPLWDDILVKHTWNTVPADWESLGRPAASTKIDLHFALKPHHENALVDALYQVSDPRRPTYGAHLSQEQVASLVAPRPDTLVFVNSWLEYHGLSSSISMTHGGGWLTVTGVPVSQADDLLSASYQLYRHTGTNDIILRTISYALPAALHAHVQTVAPTTYFAAPRKLQRTQSRPEAAATANATSGESVTVLSRRDSVDQVNPAFVRWLYKTVEYVPIATDQNTLGVVGFHDQYPSPADLTTFMRAYRVDAEDATFTVAELNGGGYDPSRPHAEGSMNIQYAETMAYPIKHTFYSVGGVQEWSDSNLPTPRDVYLAWFNHVISQPNLPRTVVISYGDKEWNIPPEYAVAVCDLFLQLGVRGVSVLFATGDDGVGKGDCKDSSGNVWFEPNFPASYRHGFAGPWITSVGGTKNFNPEVAAELSGGGFSFHFARPTYQDDAVTPFFQQIGNRYAGSYNPGGRGIPDISAQALNFAIVVANRDFIADGTSCAAPTIAGIISLLNDFLLSKGRSPLGFLNPWLYGPGYNLGGFNDITSGSNPGCGTDGFSAIDGWDPVTGLGTPDFKKLLGILEHT